MHPDYAEDRSVADGNPNPPLRIWPHECRRKWAATIVRFGELATVDLIGVNYTIWRYCRTLPGPSFRHRPLVSQPGCARTEPRPAGSP